MSLGCRRSGGKVDCAGDWSGQSESQGGVEESGLQFGSILRVGGDMSAPGVYPLGKMTQQDR